MSAVEVLRRQLAAAPYSVRSPAYTALGLARGCWPEPWANVIQPRITRNPRTFNEKQRYKMARDRRPLLRTLADRVAVRAYVTGRTADVVQVPLIEVADRVGDVRWSRLPREYVAKVSHGCGGSIVVSERADPDTRLPRARDRVGWERYRVHPDAVMPDAIGELLDYWLAQEYRWRRSTPREWCYGHLPRRVVIEPLLADRDGEPPHDVTVQCLNGLPRMVTVFTKTADFGFIAMDRYLMDEAEIPRARAGAGQSAWSAMLDASAVLAGETDALRVDWLWCDGTAWLAELTNHPAAGKSDLSGHARLTARQLDRRLGDWWVLPAHY